VQYYKGSGLSREAASVADRWGPDPSEKHIGMEKPPIHRSRLCRRGGGGGNGLNEKNKGKRLPALDPQKNVPS